MTSHVPALATPARRLSAPRAALAFAVAALLALPLSGLGHSASAAEPAPVVSLSALQVEKKTEPIGIDVQKPRFSWIIDTEARGTVQQSYRLQFAKSADALAAGDLSWDSGVVDSAESSNVEYSGPTLESASRYFWKVDVTTNAGAAAAASEFRTGLYDAGTDWHGSKWIGNDRVQATGAVELNLTGASWIHPPYSGGNTPSGYFRKGFTLDAAKTVESAELVMTGDRGFAAFLNGVQVASGASVDDQWKKAARVAVSPLAGSNLLAVRLNNTAKPFGAVVGKLTVRYTDGTTQDVVTDASWLSSESANTGWDANGYATSSWVTATARAPYGQGPWGDQVVVPKKATPDARLTFDTASWIIPPIGAPSNANRIPSTLFRKTIIVPAGKSVSFAQLAITGDQVFSAYWNGQKVAFNTGANDEWQTAKVANLTAVEGANTFAVALATNNTQYSGVLAHVRVGYTDGTSTDYVTDSSTRALVSTEANAPAGWNATGFDDSAWPNAQAQALYRGWVYGDRVSIPTLSAGNDVLDFTGVPWIWTPEASTGQAPGEDRAFRTTRATPAGLTATKADVLITADDSFRLWVNGSLIGATEGAVNEWQQSHLYSVDLAAASNVFAVRTTNGAGSAAGLIAKIRVHYSDGTTSTFTTGTDWKASKTIADGFEQPGFDDSAWLPAVQQAVYGSGPWGGGVRAPVPTPNAAPLLRKEFAVDGDVRTATLYLAAGGYADVTLNGRKISKDVLSPGFTDYDDTVQYVATDLTDQVKSGDNAIGMELGRGFYGMTGSNVWNWQSPPWHDEPVVRAVLHIEYADGSTDDVVTDDSWKIHDGPTVFDDLYGGETYDANREQPGFDTVGFDASQWAAASAVRGPKGTLVNQRQQPIRVTEALPATEITEPADGTYVVKFPRVLAGWVEFSAKGESGTTIRAQYGEKLLGSGLVNFSNNGGFGSGFQTDRFILAGTGQAENWEARFSYKGFQYIQVTGWPAGQEPTLADFTAKAVHTDAAETGTFESANDIMNRTHTAVVDTLENNIHGIPTDTPMFEKNGWTGDAAIGAEMFMMNLDVHELFAKWIGDVNDTRDAEGAPMVIAPSSGSWGEWGVAPPWHSAYILIPRWLYQYGNDSRVMRDYYDGMKGYVDLENGRTVNGIVANPRLGDWVSPEASPAGSNAPEDTRVSATAYLYTMQIAMQKTAEFLGHDADAAQFAEDAAATKVAFNATFYDAAKGYYRGNGDSGYRQTHNVLALAFGLAPDEATSKKVAASIVDDIKAKGNHLNTGVLGTKYLLPVLTAYGYSDVAYGLAVQTTYPSWGFMVENGGTTMWEHWSLDARSRGHYFLGTVDDWFYHSVAGIQSSDTTGYRDITIAPAVTKQLDWARGSVESPFGTVSTDWSSVGGQLRLDVKIPVGSTATVRVPAANAWAVSESGVAVEDADGVTKVAAEGGDILVSIGSGQYSFIVNPVVGQVGDVIDSLDRADGVIAGLREDGEVNSSQKTRLEQLVAAVRAPAIAALDAARSSDRVAAATKLAASLGALGAFDTAIASLDTSTDARAALAAASAKVRTVTDATITSLLSVTASATLDHAAYKPGENAQLLARVANGNAATITTVTASVVGLPSSWPKPAPASLRLATTLAATKVGNGTFTIAVPPSARPANQKAEAAISYTFGGEVVHLVVPISIVVDSTITVENVSAKPASVVAGGATTVSTVIRNDGSQPAVGRVQVAVPTGWVTPLPSDAVTVPAGKSITVAVPVFVPRDADQASRSVELGASFVSDGTTFGSKSANLEVVIGDVVGGEGYDHVDLGDGASEAAHGLTASSSSGTNSEAGVTRRYAGHLTPFSWFEFDLAVVKDKPFVIRSIETYDRSQTKRYKVYVDGKQVTLRQHPHTAGAGLETFEFVVPAEFATSDSVRVKFENQDDQSFYDPSIADVWSEPLATDAVAPQLAATLDPSAPNRSTGWYQKSSVGVTLAGVDDRDADVAIEYSIDGGGFAPYGSPLTVTGQGSHTLKYRATDAGGNVANSQAVVRIDSVLPKTKVVLSSRYSGNTAVSYGTVSLRSSDATSGVASTRYRLDGKGWKTGKSLKVTGTGRHTIEYAATDKAGNAAESDKVTVIIRAKKSAKSRSAAVLPFDVSDYRVR